MPANYPMNANAPSVILNVTATTATQQMTSSGTNEFVILKNGGLNPIFVVFGDSNITATYPTVGTWADGTFLLANEICTYSKDKKAATHFAYICASTLTSTLVVQVGQGL